MPRHQDARFSRRGFQHARGGGAETMLVLGAGARFHFPRLLSSHLIITTSPSLTSISFNLCFRLCRSLSALMHSPVHLDHTTSLHQRRYLALFRKSLSSIPLACSGIRFSSPCTRMLGIKVGNCRTSSA